MTTPRTLAALSASALVLTLAACSPGGDGPTEDEFYSPLNEYLSAAWGGDLSEEDWMAQAEEDQRIREEIVAECMAEQGFEYIPVVDIGWGSSSGDEWNPDDREWVAQWGYGAVRYPGMNDVPDPDEQMVDPNQEYVESLSESEMTAFYEALYGPQPTEEELNEDGSYDYNWETAGCQGFAENEISGENPIDSDEHKPLMDAINELYMQMETNPAFAEVDAEWVTCMADAGFSGFSTQPDAQNSVYDELNSYYEGMTEFIEDDPALDEIADREVELALADLDCRESTDYRERRQAVSVELEEQFIADNKAALDALVADAEQGQGQ
ncbi:hypothetical protein EV141_1222 [Microcella putealis]|uniref:Uncharacterized protein n=1 Tax=Microcella putealis TaxID=337005 RepID=A0A4Q7LUS5_9MICO|nr:hypothetical protein [Microcella putealis]RZS57509.1 hypothetical protein EV141_1222 [Microcella putealis]TQM24576.1 hypothetical protein BJ957_0831 [Microcella putealis]